ncbi:aldehyde dehydrogenase family protein [Clostridium sp.]|uniref:aldehyde dehydrogenase family protein n=1 Tax=Clostridium sp. TaxID=1506 RepID=UPI00260CFA6C|nr:aldehyde dehydrogenase family protein [Clostridium sp.]
MIIKKPIQYAIIIDKQGDHGVFDTMSDAIDSAYTACQEFSKYSLSRKNEIIEAVTNVLQSSLEELSLLTCKEVTSKSYDELLCDNTVALKNCESDKYLEARLAASNIENSNIVNGVIVSCANPIEIIIKNSILMLKAGNAIVFSSNENVKQVFAHAIKLINNAIESVNGPKNLVTTVKKPSIENTNILIGHEKINLISAIDNKNTEKIAL